MEKPLGYFQLLENKSLVLSMKLRELPIIFICSGLVSYPVKDFLDFVLGLALAQRYPKKNVDTTVAC